MSDSPLPPNPACLFELSVAYWRSAVLFTALELDLFTHIGDRRLPVTDLAADVAVSERSLSMLVDAMVALQLVEKTVADEVVNTAVSRHYLCQDQATYLGDAIMFNARSYSAWGELTAAVRKDGPVMNTCHFLGDDRDATRNFVHAMHRRAVSIASCLAPMLDLSECQTLLDLGGGPGTYSVMLAERFPQLNATVVDLPGILAVTDELVQQSPAAARIKLQPADVFSPATHFEPTFDAVLISGVLHRTDGDRTVSLLTLAADALVPGGILAVSDLFTGSGASGPVLPELFSLHMLLTADGGRSLPISEMPDAFAAAGVDWDGARPYPSPLPHTLCLGRKRCE